MMDDTVPTILSLAPTTRTSPLTTMLSTSRNPLRSRRSSPHCLAPMTSSRPDRARCRTSRPQHVSPTHLAARQLSCGRHTGQTFLCQSAGGRGVSYEHLKMGWRLVKEKKRKSPPFSVLLIGLEEKNHVTCLIWLLPPVYFFHDIHMVEETKKSLNFVNSKFKLGGIKVNMNGDY